MSLISVNGDFVAITIPPSPQISSQNVNTRLFLFHLPTGVAETKSITGAISQLSLISDSNSGFCALLSSDSVLTIFSLNVVSGQTAIAAIEFVILFSFFFIIPQSHTNSLHYRRIYLSFFLESYCFY